MNQKCIGMVSIVNIQQKKHLHPFIKEKKEGIYIETWSCADNFDTRLDFAFSQFEKDNGLVWPARKAHFKRHNFKPFNTTKMILPPSYFDEMYKRFIE